MAETFRRRFLLWLYGGLNAAIVAAAGAFVGGPLAGAVFGANTFTFRQQLASAAGVAIVAFASYVRTRQLPPLEEKDEQVS
jgi:hypothetical protein